MNGYSPPLTVDGGAVPLEVIERERTSGGYRYLICKQRPNGSVCRIYVTRKQYEAHPVGAYITANIKADIK